MMTSISVVRVSMTKTVQFLILGFIMIKGLDYLWQAPNVDNWLLIVGILGHAFVSSAVITSSFHYFMDATKFTQTVMNNKMKSA
jgi:predicted acetyltransferase